MDRDQSTGNPSSPFASPSTPPYRSEKSKRKKKSYTPQATKMSKNWLAKSIQDYENKRKMKLPLMSKALAKRYIKKDDSITQPLRKYREEGSFFFAGRLLFVEAMHAIKKLANRRQQVLGSYV